MPECNRFPPGWDEKRVQRVLAHYESQTGAEAVAEDEAAYEQEGQTIIEIPQELKELDSRYPVVVSPPVCIKLFF
ncbi:MAG: hypothetical protein ISS94_05175 [Candidatus Syntrophoarchaeum sp.]|nr:hypothetical protein [Methanomicrobia archaeon]MBL7118157.1 hypothetical protein [Candidatus Syntrophoarchaeum sp.]